MALVTAVPAWMAVASAAENYSEHRWGQRPGERWDLRDAIVNFVASEKRMKQKNHHMAKKKMDLKVEVKRLEETERLVEDADVVPDVGEDAAGLTGVVSTSNLAIHDDDDFLLDLGLEFGLRIGPRFFRFILIITLESDGIGTLCCLLWNAGNGPVGFRSRGC